MGMFDDLIPQQGTFDDLVPQKKADPKIGQPEELTFAEKLVSGVKLPDWLEHIRGTVGARVIQGMADPMIGLTQAAANVLPDATGIPQAVNKRIADLERGYQAERKLDGSEGADLARLAGNVASPVNAIPAGRLAEATTAGRMALQGAGVGAASGLAAPVNDATDGFWGKKAGQVALGAASGAVLTPIMGKVAEVAMRKLGIGATPNVRASTHDVDGAVADALKETGQSIADVPPDQLQALRDQVSASLAKGQKLDAAAALRKADFEALGMEPTLGQITRDPMQFAREQNLRGVEGVGEPLLARLQDQGTRLQAAVPQGGGKPTFQAGTQLSESLAGVDDKLRRHVSGLYGEARASAGKDLEIPLQGLAQDYAGILQRYGNNVPDAVQSQFRALGLDPAIPSNQRQLFTFERANQLLQDLNKLDPRGTNPPVSAAIGEIRQRLRDAVTSADSSGGPFAPAVKAAAERFKLHDAIPALKAAAEGSVAPDDFVRRFVVNGKTNEVKGLAKVLKAADPDSFQEARAQLGDELRRAAFGEVNSATGDAPFSPARYMATIRRIGPDKLSAFFEPQEVADILRVGRVGAYVKSAPNAAAVNTSNTAGALTNVLTKLPGVSPVVSLGNRAVNTVKNNATVRNSLAAEVPTTQAPLSERQRNILAYLLSLSGGSAGALAR